MNNNQRKDKDKIKEVAISIAQQAGSFLLRHFQRDSSLLLKRATAKELTTTYDKQSDRLIVKELTKHFPSHSILAEESGFHYGKSYEKSAESVSSCPKGRGLNGDALFDRRISVTAKSDYLWIVDPLDGSTNFARGLPFFAVSLALQKENELVLGIIYAPALDELYVAEKGRGAFLNGKRVHISNISHLHKSYLVSCGGGEKTNQRISKINARLHPLVKDLRKLGSAALEGASVACGRSDAYFAAKMNSWDVAGAVLLVKEAGGEVTDWKGQSWTAIKINPATRDTAARDSPAAKDILFSNGKLHQAILTRLQ